MISLAQVRNTIDAALARYQPRVSLQIRAVFTQMCRRTITLCTLRHLPGATMGSILRTVGAHEPARPAPV
jgi:phage baseplate assembly protein W